MFHHTAMAYRQERDVTVAAGTLVCNLMAYVGRTSCVIARVAGLLMIVGSLALVGCVEDKVNDAIDDFTTLEDNFTTLEIENEPLDAENAELVENLTFEFNNGDAFHPGLDGDATTLVFNNITDDTGTFTLSSGGNTATGTATFGSCNLEVTDSDFTSGEGPQQGETIELPTCNFSIVVGLDELENVAPLQLTVGNNEGVTSTSDDVDVDVSKLCLFVPSAIPAPIADKICS